MSVDQPLGIERDKIFDADVLESLDTGNRNGEGINIRAANLPRPRVRISGIFHHYLSTLGRPRNPVKKHVKSPAYQIVRPLGEVYSSPRIGGNS